MSTLQALPLPVSFEDWCELFLLYIAYSTLGWCGEMLYCSIPKGKLCEKRGFLNGFLCPIYGHGALLVLYALHGGFQNPFLTFFFGAIVTSILEYFTSWLMEKLFHMRWWDYSHYKFQINGRVCLLNSTCFGLACVLLCHLVQPWLWARVTGLGAAVSVPLASISSQSVSRCTVVFSLSRWREMLTRLLTRRSTRLTSLIISQQSRWSHSLSSLRSMTCRPVRMPARGLRASWATSAASSPV